MDDLIRRQDAIDAMKNLCEECDAEYCGECRINCPDKDAKSALEALPSANPWIPCSKGLPSDYVLFCDLDGDVYYGHRMDNKWWAEGCDDRIKNVIAWMPRPEPWKGD